MVPEDGTDKRLLEDEYLIADVLGSGGFSVVRKGVSITDGSEVAIKTLKRQGFAFGERERGSPSPRGGEGGSILNHNDNNRRSFKCAALEQGLSISEALLANEIVVMRRIVEEVAPHPNVVHLLDVFDDEVGVHLVLELCAGKELFDRIVTQEKYSETMAAAVIQQLANGLCSLHKAQIVHRDLKPENCLYVTEAEDSTLKIMDFGLSHIDGTTNPVVGMFGSIDYVAPEILRRRPVTPATDMWSLGVILYILLSGYPPFRAQQSSSKQKKAMILHGNFGEFREPTWKTVSASAKELIAKLLTLNPKGRPTAADLLEHPWVTGAAARREPVDANVFRRLQSFNARRKFRAAGFASLLTSKFLLRTKHLRSLMGSEKILDAEQIQNLHGHFKRISSNGVSIRLPEFEQVLIAMDMKEILPLAPKIFDLFDDNKDGCVDSREIVVGFSTLKKSHGDEGLQLCFQLYDTDRSGYISKSELFSMLRALPEEYLPVDVTEPGIMDEMFERMDANSDGRISLEEFKNAIHVNSFLQDAVLSPLHHSPGLDSSSPSPRPRPTRTSSSGWDRIFGAGEE